jgi:hypothetical protein
MNSMNIKQNMTKHYPQRLLGVFAHPDDESFCACGYQDSRFEKSFCPHCGQPLPAVVHPSTKESSQESLNVQVLAERSSRSVGGRV